MTVPPSFLFVPATLFFSGHYDSYFEYDIWACDQAVTSVANGKATLYWLPSTANPANDPPPSSVTVWEYGNARAVVQNSQYSKVLLPMPGSPRVSADDGLKDPCITSEITDVVSPPSPPGEGLIDEDYTAEATSYGYHLHTYAVSIQSGTLTSANCPGIPSGWSYNYSGKVQLPAITQTDAARFTQCIGAHSDVLCDATIGIDNRIVNITSPQTTWKQPLTKGSRTLTDQDGDPVWIVAPNVPSGGAMWGDIGIPDGPPVYVPNAYGPGYGYVESDAPNYVSVTYQAQALGWNTTEMKYLWNDSVTGKSTNGTYGAGHSGIGPFSATYVGAVVSKSGSVGVNDANPGKPSHIFLRVTDNSGTTGTANFYMRIHRGWEVLPSKKKSPGDGDLYEPAKIIGYLPNGTTPYGTVGAAVDFQYETPNAGYGDVSTGYALHLISDLLSLFKLNEAAAAAFAALGDTTDHFFEEKKSTKIIMWDTYWGVTNKWAKDNVPSSTYVDGNNHVVSFDSSMDPANFLMYAHFEAQYQPTWHRGDAYGTGGFVGETKFHTDIWTGGGFPWAEFKWNPKIKHR